MKTDNEVNKLSKKSRIYLIDYTAWEVINASSFTPNNEISYKKAYSIDFNKSCIRGENGGVLTYFDCLSEQQFLEQLAKANQNL